MLNIAAGRSSGHHLVGMSAHGGHGATMLALYRAGLVTPGDQTLTPDGVAMVERIKAKG